MPGKPYGATRTWSTIGAPHPISGICDSFSESDALQTEIIDGEAGIAAIVMHGRKSEISMEGKVTSETTNYLNLQDGVKIALEGYASGVTLVEQCEERWSIGQAKRFSMSARYYPDMTDASGASVDDELSAVTPAQSGLSIFPASKVIYSTAGLTHTSGVVQELTIAQSVEIQEETDELGKIVAAWVSNYQRKINLTLKTGGTKPVPGTVLEITGAPAHGMGYRIVRSDIAYQIKGIATYTVEALWVPVFSEDDVEPEE